MVITVEERRNTLKLFNVSEAARKLGIPVQEMHRRLKAGQLPMPEVRSHGGLRRLEERVQWLQRAAWTRLGLVPIQSGPQPVDRVFGSCARTATDIKQHHFV